MDIIDRANDQAEAMLERQISAARGGNGLDAIATAKGYCLNCGPSVPLPAGRRWCDGDCRDDWCRAQSLPRAARLTR